MRIRIFDDAARLADAAAQEIESWIRLSTPDATLGLSGGSTPRTTYERLRLAKLPWEHVNGWMIDERFVSPTDPDRNSKMVGEALFDHVPAGLLTVPWIEDPIAAAEQYQRQLATVLPQAAGGLKPGLIVLGVGTDGHTASLFPGTDAVDVMDRDFVANWVPQLESWRFTATMPLLQRARRTMFLVSGAHKAQIVADVLEGDGDYPAAWISRESKDAVWLIDRAAAGRLSA